MKDNFLEQILKSIKITGSYIQIDELKFRVKKMVGQGYHKQVFEIDDGENNKVIKIIRKEAEKIESALLSFQQAIENQKILDDFGVNYAKIVSFDKKGPPYRFLIQEKIAENGIARLN